MPLTSPHFDFSSRLLHDAGLVSEPQSKVEEDGARQRRAGRRQRADERGHSPIPQHQLPVAGGPRQEAEGAAGDAAEVGANDGARGGEIGEKWVASRRRDRKLCQ